MPALGVGVLAGAGFLAVACGEEETPRASAADAGIGGPWCAGHDLFREQCSGGVCHHAGPGRARGLDLVSPAPASRLVGVSATCPGRLLIDPVAPERSFILEKISSDTPECGGSRMPLSGAALPPETVACVRKWMAVAVAARR